MEWTGYVILILLLILIDVESKLSKLIKNQNTDINKNDIHNILKKVVNKKVSLIIDNDSIIDSHLFSDITNTVGVIKEYDDVWLLFEYETKKDVVSRYFRISDITSINEVADK